MTTKLNKFKDVTGYLSKLQVGESIPAERDLADIIGYSRQNIREILNHLEGKGFIKIEHGKSTRIMKSLEGFNLSDLEVSDKNNNHESTLRWVLERTKNWSSMNENDMRATLSDIEDEISITLDS